MSNPAAADPSPPVPSADRPRRVFMTAAEVSGDRHGAQFIRSLREILPDVRVEALGGPEMAAAGATVLRETVANAAMGWRGALRAVEVYKLLAEARRRFDADPPDLWVGVDSPSMNFHFARAAKERGIPTLQFVAPQLWGWAEWRMKKLRRWVDRVACIMPFEEAYFRGHGVSATFVGHPLFDELPARRDRPPGPHHPDAPPVIGLLPGSRRGVAAANFPRQLAVAVDLLGRFPDARFLVPTTPATDPIVRRHLADSALPKARVEVGVDAFDQMVPACDLCLTVSGTATLHVASYGVPMVVVYHGSPVLWNLLGRWLIRSRTFAMVNLLADPTPLAPDPGRTRQVVPEVVPWYGPTGGVADLAADLLRHPDRLAAQRARLGEMVRRLDKPGASAAVARVAAEMMAARE
jgi:lipid-A-disaccharide synthase